MEYIQELQKFLQKQGFGSVKNTDGFLWIRENKTEVALMEIVPEPLPGQQVVSMEIREGRMKDIEKNLMIQAGKPVDRLTLVLYHEMPSREEIEEMTAWPNVWMVDWKQGRILVFERQRTDFQGLREKLEQMTADYVKEEQNESRREWKRLLQPVTLTLIAANVLVFFILSLLGDTEDAVFMGQHGALVWEKIMGEGEYYRLFTSMFLHFGPEHLLQNMLILLLVGTRLERVLGKMRYGIVYFGAGFIGALASLAFTLSSDPYTVAAGASGAIFGVMGGLLLLIVKDMIQGERRRIKDIGLAGILFMVAAAGSYGLFEAGVDNAAHLGGLLGGFLLTAITSIGL